ncbi:hypothetical protein B0T20DRAFT_320644, partial [Sordaria brevicollis]
MLEANATLVDWQVRQLLRPDMKSLSGRQDGLFPSFTSFLQTGFRGLCPIQEVAALLHRDLLLASSMKFSQPV